MSDTPPIPPPQPLASPLAYAAPAVESADVSHLKLLSIFYFILSPVVILFGSFPILHVVLGYLMYTGKMQGGNANDNAARWIGIVVMVFGGGFVLLAWTLGLLSMFAGLQLRTRRRWTLCMVVASAICVFMPLGTILGIFTIVVLMRPTVRPLFS